MRLEELASPRFRLECGGRALGLDALLARAEALRGAVEAQGEPGSVVAVPARDPGELIASLGAAWAAGRTPVPLGEVDAIRALPLPRTSSALIVRTSGSTGAPRYPEFDAASVRTSAATIAAYLELDAGDRVALVQPLEHSFGLVGQLFAAMRAGATAVWASSPYPDERAEAVVASRPTVLAAVPFLLAQMLDFGLAEAPLRSVGSAGGPLPQRLGERLVGAFPRAVVWNQYGCTEAGPRLTACPSTSAAFANGSVGKPIAGVTVRVAPDDGRIVFESPMAMRGYLGDEAATAAASAGNGFYSGDVGRIDDEGNLFIAGRSDDIVKLRGVKVSLRNVAQAIEARGARAAVAVLLAPAAGPAGGDADGTLFALFEGDDDIPLSSLADALPLHSMPSRIQRVRALPRLANGKIDRLAAHKLLRELHAPRTS